MREYKTIISVFAGRERYMKILNEYIDLGLKLNIIDEYHIMNFTFNRSDNDYVINLQKRMNEKYEGRVNIHYSEENLKTIEELEKNKLINKKNIMNNENEFNNTGKKWKNFYKILGDKIGDEKSVIIKCDDDILFIDINNLEKAYYQRWINKYPFIMHSNCINNGVCAYYQRDKFEKISDMLLKYPKGGICGIIFEKPELSMIMHYNFLDKLLEKNKLIENLKKYYLDKNKYISTRISINFVLMHGEDIKYLKDIGDNDEYELSSKVPEKLLRPNLILKDMVTSHFSYGMQDKILKQRPDILKMYEDLMKEYMENVNIKKEFMEEIKKECMEEIKKENKYKCKKISENKYYVKNPILDNEYIIRDIKSGKYIYYDFEKKKLILDDEKYTYLEITNIKNNIGYITLGIHPLTRYNVPNDILNDMIYMKSLVDNREKLIEIRLKDNEKEKELYEIVLCKNKLNLINDLGEIKFKNIKEDEIKDNLWEIINGKKMVNYEEYIEVERIYIEKTDNYKYKNTKNNEIYYNTYSGWKLETLFMEDDLEQHIEDEIKKEEVEEIKLKEDELDQQLEDEIKKEEVKEIKLKEDELEECLEDKIKKEEVEEIKLKEDEMKKDEKKKKRTNKSKIKKELISK